MSTFLYCMEIWRSPMVELAEPRQASVSRFSCSDKYMQVSMYFKCLVNLNHISLTLIFFVPANRLYYFSYIYLHAFTYSFGVLKTSVSYMLQRKGVSPSDGRIPWMVRRRIQYLKSYFCIQCTFQVQTRKSCEILDPSRGYKRSAW